MHTCDAQNLWTHMLGQISKLENFWPCRKTPEPSKYSRCMHICNTQNFWTHMLGQIPRLENFWPCGKTPEPSQYSGCYDFTSSPIPFSTPYARLTFFIVSLLFHIDHFILTDAVPWWLRSSTYSIVFISYTQLVDSTTASLQPHSI